MLLWTKTPTIHSKKGTPFHQPEVYECCVPIHKTRANKAPALFCRGCHQTCGSWYGLCAVCENLASPVGIPFNPNELGAAIEDPSVWNVSSFCCLFLVGGLILKEALHVCCCFEKGIPYVCGFVVGLFCPEGVLRQKEISHQCFFVVCVFRHFKLCCFVSMETPSRWKTGFLHGFGVSAPEA